MSMWMVVTADRYELPIDFDDNRDALAARLGIKPNTLTQMVRRQTSKNGFRIIKIKLEED